MVWMTKALWLLAHALLALPVLTVALQIVLARRMPRPDDHAAPGLDTATARGALAVVVPAHNERSGIGVVLEALKLQLQVGDRLIVVADNCSDDTAAVARSHGAEVLERAHLSLRGKGYALDHGVAHLKTMGAPAAVLICDADCLMTPGSVQRLLQTCLQRQRPVQALYLMNAAPGAGMQQRFAAFAWRVKNHVRASGGGRLGMPCQLMGTGMMFPWASIVDAPLASGHLAEDVQLGVNLALAGQVPIFEPDALVTSEFPQSTTGTQTQRARWEQGALANMVDCVPTLLKAGVTQGRASLIGMALDLMVPPLALLVMLLLGMVVVDLVITLLTGWQTALVVSVALFVMLACSVLLAWVRHGQGTVTAAELAAAPWYALRKIPIYLAFLAKRQTQWVRTKRDDE